MIGFIKVRVDGGRQPGSQSPLTGHWQRTQVGDRKLGELHRKAGFQRIDVERYHDTAPTLDRSGTIEREELFVVSIV